MLCRRSLRSRLMLKVGREARLTTRASSFTVMRPFLAAMASPQAAQASLSTSMPFVFSRVCNTDRVMSARPHRNFHEAPLRRPST